MKELRIDRERAIKLAAMAGLVILGLSILPGLLRTPKAPELPPDVGFTAAETGPGTSLPDPGKTTVKRTAGKAKENAKQNRNPRRARDRKERKPRHKPHRRTPKARRKAAQGRSNPPERDATATPAAPATPPPVVATPAPAPVAPAPAPPPPAPAPAPSPGDGSQEFAPR